MQPKEAQSFGGDHSNKRNTGSLDRLRCRLNEGRLTPYLLMSSIFTIPLCNYRRLILGARHQCVAPRGNYSGNIALNTLPRYLKTSMQGPSLSPFLSSTSIDRVSGLTSCIQASPRPPEPSYLSTLSSRSPTSLKRFEHLRYWTSSLCSYLYHLRVSMAGPTEGSDFWETKEMDP